MNLQELMDRYHEEGLTRELAAARVCQDIVLKAIADGPLSRNVTIKGGVVMRSLTNNNRRATRDIDLDFIHYSLNEEAIRIFIDKMNCIEGLGIKIEGDIKELKHQDYHGKSIEVVIRDNYGNDIRSKIDIGVHKHLGIEQEEYCFDVCLDETGASLLKNTVEQAFAEKLRSLLIFGPNSRRYKDIYDMYYLINEVEPEKLNAVLGELIYSDSDIRENTIDDILKRVRTTFSNDQYLGRVSSSRQRWIDEDIHVVAEEIMKFLSKM